MIDGIANPLNASKASSSAGAGASSGTGQVNGKSFSDVLKDSIDEVSKLQQDASRAVDDVASGKSDDVTGVMTAMEKSDLAFKTLLSIRAKLMDAYEEIKGISV